MYKFLITLESLDEILEKSKPRIVEDGNQELKGIEVCQKGALYIMGCGGSVPVAQLGHDRGKLINLVSSLF